MPVLRLRPDAASGCGRLKMKNPGGAGGKTRGRRRSGAGHDGANLGNAGVHPLRTRYRERRVHKTVIWLLHDEIVAAFPATSTQPQAPPLPGRGFLLSRGVCLTRAVWAKTSLRNLASRCPAEAFSWRAGQSGRHTGTELSCKLHHLAAANDVG